MSRESVVGRERERAVILRALDEIDSGGGAIVVEGEAGIGKSMLLAEASTIAHDRGMLVLSATGVQSEAQLPFAGLHQLLRPVLSRVAELPTPQRKALDRAFGLGDGAPGEPFVIALGVLGLVSDVSSDLPLLMSVEDAHWLDRPTADALAFVGRRLESDAIVMLAAIRDDYESPLRERGLTRLALGRLNDKAAQQLLRERFPNLVGAARDRVLDSARGNPLALVELARGRGSEPNHGDADLLARLPLTERLERAFAARADELPAATRTMLLVAATEEDPSLATVIDAAGIAEGSRPTLRDLEPAIATHLIQADADSVHFRHPLVRSAIYQSAAVGERQAAHAAIAQVLADDPDRSVWHRAAATISQDPELAYDLEQAGTRALGRGAAATAAAAFERAAALTGDQAHRGRLLLSAAATASELGHGEAVLRLLREAESLDLSLSDHARWVLIEDHFRSGPIGDLHRVRELVDLAVKLAATGDDALAPDLLVAAANRCYWGNLRLQGREVVRAAENLGLAPDDQRTIFIQAFAMPIERGRAVLQQLERTAPTEDPTALYLRGIAVCLTGAFERAMPLLDASAQRLREQGRLQLLAQVLSFRAWAAVELGNFAIAIPAAEESSRLSTEGQQPLWQSGALLAQAHIAAMRGDRATVERIINEIAPIALPIGAAPLLSLSQVASGVLELGEARHAEAYEHLRRLFQPGDPACHDLTACHSIGDMVEAAVHSGHRDEAVALMSATEQYVEELPSSWFHAQLLLGRVQLAAEGSSDVFEKALTADLSAYPIMRARIELLYGEWLRRHRRRRESRGPLRAARETFDALGLSPWAERARRELRASGETSRRRAPDTLDELTPQELQIVQMAARGLSNRDIAQQLYLSHRTVETHLYRIFPKLGVTSRVQLVAALGGRIGAPV